MKTILGNRILFLIMLLLPLSGISQWTNHYNFPIPLTYPTCSGTFNDALFISVDTGFYCMSEYCSPSNQYAYLWRTVDDCASWEMPGFSGFAHAYAIKYFPPYIYYLINIQGFLRIYYGVQGFGFTNLFWKIGFYKDFFANSPTDFKIIYDDSKFEHDLNGVMVISQYFSEFKLQKMYFPIDTVGVFIARLPSGSSNTLIVKHTPSTGFNIVYENPAVNLNCIEFTGDLTGYVGGSNGFMMRTDDLGDTWVSLITGINMRLNSIDFVDDNTGYAVGDGQTIINTEDKGESWTAQTPPVSGNYSRVFFVSQVDGFILCGQKLLKTTNGGITWIAEEPFRDNELHVSPNPASDNFKINLSDNLDIHAQYLMTITDLVGNIVVRQNVQVINGTFQFNLDDPKPGLYQLVLISDDQQYHTKLIIK